MLRDDALTHTDRPINTLQLAALMRRTVEASCKACRHHKAFDAIPLWWLFSRRGWSDHLREVPARLYCSQCWEQRFRKIREPSLMLTRNVPLGLQPPYPDHREWKRIVARFRS